MTPSEEAGGEARCHWRDLDAEEQLRLRIEYGRYLDGLPPTCSMEEKNARFARWLATHGIEFEPL